MKLYFISRTDEIGDNEYDSFVVAAESFDSAIKMSPSPYGGWGDWEQNNGSLTIQCIGESNSKVEEVIIASFNAG